jgi:hypothetical protein
MSVLEDEKIDRTAEPRRGKKSTAANERESTQMKNEFDKERIVFGFALICVHSRPFPLLRVSASPDKKVSDSNAMKLSFNLFCVKAFT